MEQRHKKRGEGGHLKNRRLLKTRFPSSPDTQAISKRFSPPHVTLFVKHGTHEIRARLRPKVGGALIASDLRAHHTCTRICQDDRLQIRPVPNTYYFFFCFYYFLKFQSRTGIEVLPPLPYSLPHTHRDLYACENDNNRPQFVHSGDTGTGGKK